MTKYDGPEFVVIGEQKCGTGWIRDRLIEHPEVYMQPREVNFFSHSTIYARGIDWYRKLFPPNKSGLVRGEKSPEYFWFVNSPAHYNDHIPDLIRRHLPKARVILTLRNPADRAVSALHHHLYHRGRRINPREARRHTIGDFLFGEFAEEVRRFGVLERGLYAERVARIQDLFGDDLVVLVFEEDIVHAPEHGLRTICHHIGVEYRDSVFRHRHNKKANNKPSYFRVWAGYHVPILRPVLRWIDPGPVFRIARDPDLKDRLYSYYDRDIRETERVLRRRLAVWRT